MGIVSQDFKLLRDRTVNENVAFALEVTGHPRSEAKNKASEILRKVGLEAREQDTILALSAGEQQRVTIARALVNDPQVLLADEPTGQLDATTSLEILKLITQIHEQGRTVILVTHDSETAAYAQRKILLNDGRIETA